MSININCQIDAAAPVEFKFVRPDSLSRRERNKVKVYSIKTGQGQFIL